MEDALNAARYLRIKAASERYSTCRASIYALLAAGKIWRQAGRGDSDRCGIVEAHFAALPDYPAASLVSWPVKWSTLRIRRGRSTAVGDGIRRPSLWDSDGRLLRAQREPSIVNMRRAVNAGPVGSGVGQWLTHTAHAAPSVRNFATTMVVRSDLAELDAGAHDEVRAAMKVVS